ncbi:MAG TPA: hypothetical protein VES01_02130 [Dermatophilaceae bacterium]|nr:hypothetical protein [Dermatophilaceae bacterium]
MLRHVHAREYAVTGPSGRHYRIIFSSSGHLRGYWCVCNPGGAYYATFATVPAARRWALTN